MHENGVCRVHEFFYPCFICIFIQSTANHQILFLYKAYASSQRSMDLIKGFSDIMAFNCADEYSSSVFNVA